MKNKKCLVLTISLVVVVIVVLIVAKLAFPGSEGANNLFSCKTIGEMEQYATDNNIAYEVRDNQLHLYNAEFLGQKGYCTAEFQFNTNETAQITFYMTAENDAALLDMTENVKKAFLEEFGFEADYEYYPLVDDMETAGEKDFKEQKASKELYVYDKEAVWSISWLITDQGVSAKINKSVNK